jgi:hypothetical protein
MVAAPGLPGAQTDPGLGQPPKNASSGHWAKTRANAGEKTPGALCPGRPPLHTYT